MDIRNVAGKGHNARWALYKRNKFVEYIGSDIALAKWKQKRENAMRILESNGKPPTPDMPIGVYDVIYADPPWRYDFDVDSRATEKHYPTLTLKQIRNLKDSHGVRIQEKFDNNAILYLWATTPKLNEALAVLQAWGFTYKTSMVWIKDKIGLGWYCRNQHELLLIAEKGNIPLPEANVRPSSVMKYPRTTHSTKPLELYGLLERWYPGRRYLEVFGVNNTRPNWAVFGNNIYE